MPKLKRSKSGDRNILPLRDFSGGLNTNDLPENIAYNEVQDCENVFFDVKPKGIVKRGGKQILYNRGD